MGPARSPQANRARSPLSGPAAHTLLLCSLLSARSPLRPACFRVVPAMSTARGSVTPTAVKQRAFDYPLTPAQQATLSTPIHIAPRASPRGAPSASGVAAANAQISMAQSCPTFSWQPPAAPSARPRIASIDPPPMELPPSPPVFSPMQAEAVKGKKDDPASSIALKKQIYSRSLSNYSSSAPTHVDYLSKFQPNLGQLDEGGAAGDDSDEDEEETNTRGYRPSGRAQQQQRRDVDDESPTLGEAAAAPASTTGGIGIGVGKSNRVTAIARGDDFSLSKSPTIFSILSTSAHTQAHPGLHTADTSTSSTASGSPGHSILGSIAAGETVPKRKSLQSHKPPSAVAADSAASRPAPAAEDDLQFDISLTDEQEGEGDDGQGQKQEFQLY